MASRSISAKIKREDKTVTIEGFATNVGIQSITWNDDYHRIVIDYVNDQGQTQRESMYDKNFANIKFKTAENKAKAIQYQMNMFASLCQSVKPDLVLVDTQDLAEAYGEYVSQIADLLPSPCTGELKLVFKESKGKYYNFKPSRDLPVYTNSVKPMQVKFTDNDKAFMEFTVEEPQPDQEAATTTATVAIPKPTTVAPPASDDIPF
jgi:hypothetical protein